MARYFLTLPDINYPEGFQFPTISNFLIDYPMPDKFTSWGAVSFQNTTIPLHGFVRDHILETIWRDEYKGIQKIINHGVVVAPDFTVEHDYPLPLAFYNVWRSRVVGRYWQDCGLFVIPALQWAKPEINEQLFKGLQDCQIVAVRSPTRGSVTEWELCAAQYLQTNHPLLVLHFGTSAGFGFWSKNGVNAVNLNLRG